MHIEKTEDLIHWTYYMIDWKTAVEKPSHERCVRCGGVMSSVELIAADTGLNYDGLVCHACKSVIWMKR